MDGLVEHLRERLSGTLPGRDAQLRMAHLKRVEALQHWNPPPENARVACVLNLLHWEGEQWRTLLIRRTVNPRDQHSGQVSFPGGRRESSDESLERAALREAQEETAVPVHRVEILGQLTSIYIPISNFIVYPFVGVLDGPAAFSPQQGEVEEILTPGIQDFEPGLNVKRRDMHFANGNIVPDVPYFDVNGHIIWGATAMILSEFMALLEP